MLNYQRVYQNDNVIVAHVPSTQFWPCGMVETIPKKGFFGSPPARPFMCFRTAAFGHPAHDHGGVRLPVPSG